MGDGTITPGRGRTTHRNLRNDKKLFHLHEGASTGKSLLMITGDTRWAGVTKEL